MRLRTGIDVGSALDLVGGVLKWLAPAFLLPVVVAIGYGEPFWPFLVAGAITGLAGLALDQITGEKHGAAITPRESFIVVALIWLLVPIFGALPFVLDGGAQLSRPVDAYFETVSGFTATGARNAGASPFRTPPTRSSAEPMSMPVLTLKARVRPTRRGATPRTRSPGRRL